MHSNKFILPSITLLLLGCPNNEETSVTDGQPITTTSESQTSSTSTQDGGDSPAIETTTFPTTSDSEPLTENMCGKDFEYVHVESGQDLSTEFTAEFIKQHERPVGILHWTGTGDRICSGTLIADDLFLTAGHCIEDKETNKLNCEPGESCKDILHVDFNYQYAFKDGQQQGLYIHNFNHHGDPYECEEVKECVIYNGVDYAVLKLAGSPGQKYGKANLFADASMLKKGDSAASAALIGHPKLATYPVKTASAGPITEINKPGISYQIDVTSGSSGAGILVSLLEEPSQTFLVGVHNGPDDCSLEDKGNYGTLVEDILENNPNSVLKDLSCGCQTPSDNSNPVLPECEKTCDENENQVLWKDQCGFINHIETCSMYGEDHVCEPNGTKSYCDIICDCKISEGDPTNLPLCNQQCSEDKGSILWKDICGKIHHSENCKQNGSDGICMKDGGGPFCTKCSDCSNPSNQADNMKCSKICSENNVVWKDQCGAIDGVADHCTLKNQQCEFVGGEVGAECK